MSDLLRPGEKRGLGNAGWPPATIVRDQEGRYYIERLTQDLKDVRRGEISEEDARAWIEDDNEEGNK